MTEADTLRCAIRTALAHLDVGEPPNVEQARRYLAEALRTPRETQA